MCGIAGIVNSSSQKKVEPNHLHRMLEAVNHRGPDDEGFFYNNNIGLGHKRLSIIDLNNGNQPMHNEKKNLYTIFNGEIYNFKDIKYECEELGYIFKTKSDTEIILAAYELFGSQFLSKLNGMFSFVIYDITKNLILLARDRLGKKPLYYSKSENIFLFASEIKSIIKHPNFNKSINHEALYDYFLYQYIPDSKTIFKNISQIPPGHFMILKDNKIFLDSYWKVNIDLSSNFSKNDYVDKLKYLLVDSTKIRMNSDVPYGSFLSGGIDSTIITSIMSSLSSEKIKSFSLSGGDGEYNELEYAKLVSIKNNTYHKDFHLDDLNFVNTLTCLSQKIDQPFGDSSVIPTYLISKYAKKDVTVALSGEGGDELFGGYNWYRNFILIRKYWKKLPLKLRNILSSVLINTDEPRNYKSVVLNLIKKMSLANKLSFESDHKDYIATSNAYNDHFRNYIVNKEFVQNINREDLQENNDYLKIIFENNQSDDLNKLLLHDLNTYLVGDLLFKVDRMSMLNSLEIRAPLLDYRIVELAMQIPQELKINNRNTKFILKEAARDYIPTEILNRKNKRGFSIPVNNLIRGKLKTFITDEILSDHIFSDGLISKKNIETILKKHFSEKFDYGPQIWSFLMYSLWKKNFT